MTFEVIDKLTSIAIVTETFTLTIVDCSDPDSAGFADDPLGVVTDQRGQTGFTYVWHIGVAADYIYTFDTNTLFVHDNALCGSYTVSF